MKTVVRIAATAAGSLAGLALFWAPWTRDGAPLIAGCVLVLAACAWSVRRVERR
jgi:hypothetical protein